MLLEVSRKFCQVGSDVLQHDLVLINFVHLGHSGTQCWRVELNPAAMGGRHPSSLQHTGAGERSVCHAGCSGGGLLVLRPPKVLLSPSCPCASSWSCSCLGCCAYAPARYWCSFNCPLGFRLVKWVSKMALAVTPRSHKFPGGQHWFLQSCSVSVAGLSCRAEGGVQLCCL